MPASSMRLLISRLHPAPVVRLVNQSQSYLSCKTENTKLTFAAGCAAAVACYARAATTLTNLVLTKTLRDGVHLKNLASKCSLTLGG